MRGRVAAVERISIHTPLAGSDVAPRPSRDERIISIHTPLAGSDLQSLLGLGALLGISIHTPLAGSDVTDSLEPSPVQFQSTLPLRGATG